MSEIVKSPFSDAIGPDTVPKTSSGSVSVDHEPGMPVQRDGGLLKEVYRDNTFGKPSKSGPITHVPFKDAV